MYTYTFVTPSDPITFKASSDKIAYACAISLGNGKAGCHRYEDGEEINLQTMVMFSEDPNIPIKQYLGCELIEFEEANLMEMADCFDSFAYGDIEDRRTYDDAVEAITDPAKLAEFKAKHEDRNRSSMSQWVKGAWTRAKYFNQLAKEKQTETSTQ